MSDVLEYKCPACGGTLAFDADTRKMKCPYCDSEFDVDKAKAIQPVSIALEEKPTGELRDVTSFSCPSCGGEIIGDANFAATHCPFCGNTAIISSRLAGVLRPDLVIPFAINKEAAKEALKDFYKGKILMPDMFMSENRIEDITGLYVPFWLFDCEAGGSVEYSATRVSMWQDRRFRYIKTDHYRIFRDGNVSFSRVPVDGSKKMADDYMEAIEPFDYSGMTDFDTPYLAGYGADKYDVSADESVPRVHERLKNTLLDLFAQTVSGYATVAPARENLRFSHHRAKYALLPVWVLNTVYRGETWMFAMNGQTGKFVGKLPMSWGKFWAWFLGLFAGLGAIGTVVVMLL
jgi:DNA-directed RNA polymerase subunit RPC12/RpoP